jgi:hypothetical protein
MKFFFEAYVRLTLDHTRGAKTSLADSADIALELSKNLDKSKYLDKKGLPNAEGSKVISNVLVAGLISNIHHAHAKGYRNEIEHLKHIISELERGWAHPIGSLEEIDRS